jgi:hypothetical protein
MQLIGCRPCMRGYLKSNLTLITAAYGCCHFFSSINSRASGAYHPENYSSDENRFPCGAIFVSTGTKQAVYPNYISTLFTIRPIVMRWLPQCSPTPIKCIRRYVG